MKKITFKMGMFLLALCTLCACSDDEEVMRGTIYGKITDPSGENLASVTMTLSPGGLSRTTGNDGTFEMIDLEPGQYTLQAQKSGYKTNTKTVNIVAGQTASGDMVLTHTVKDAEITITPSALNFGNTQTEMAVTITNNGNASSAWSLDLGNNSTWLSASPTSGNIGASKTQSIIFTVDRSKIVNSKSVVINLSANGSTYPINVVCNPASSKNAVMSISPKLLDFGSTIQKLSFEVKNIGTADLNWIVKELTEQAITLSSASGVVAPGGANLVFVQVDRSKLTNDIQTSFIVSDGNVDEAVTVKISKDGDNNGGEDNETPGEEVGETVVPEGLYVYYKFNGDFNDATENEINCFGIHSPTFVDGITADSKAIKFNRTDDSYFNVPVSIMDREEMSVCFWGKDFSDGNIFHTINNGNYPIHSLTMEKGSLKYVALQNCLIYGNYDNVNAFAHPTLSDGKWHHIAITTDFDRTTKGASTAKLYVDGNLVDVTTHGGTTNSNGTYGTGTKFVMGSSVKLGYYEFAGSNMSVDNFRVYDSRSLSAKEVKAIYNAKQ